MNFFYLEKRKKKSNIIIMCARIDRQGGGSTERQCTKSQFGQRDGQGNSPCPIKKKKSVQHKIVKNI